MSSLLSRNGSAMLDLCKYSVVAGSDEGQQIVELEWVCGYVAVHKWLGVVLWHDVCANIALLKHK